MMRLGKDLEGKPIISVADGRILGRVKDVYIDRDLQRLAGLYVGSEGVIRRKSLIVPSDQIVLLGVDVVLVKDADVITTNKALPETEKWLRQDDLVNTEVRTPGGTKLGTVGDIILDEQGGVSALALARVFVSGPLAQKGMIPRDVLVEILQADDTIQVDLPKLESLLAGISDEAQASAGSEADLDDVVINPVESDSGLDLEPDVKKLDEEARD
jgi:uncharacterized protein YrrD